MKITKEKLKEIIAEELRVFEQDEQEPEDQSVASRTEFAMKLKELSIAMQKATGIDSSEVQLINSILDMLIQAANEGSARSILTQLQTLISKKIG